MICRIEAGRLGVCQYKQANIRKSMHFIPKFYSFVSVNVAESGYQLFLKRLEQCCHNNVDKLKVLKASTIPGSWLLELHGGLRHSLLLAPCQCVP